MRSDWRVRAGVLKAAWTARLGRALRRERSPSFAARSTSATRSSPSNWASPPSRSASISNGPGASRRGPRPAQHASDRLGAHRRSRRRHPASVQASARPLQCQCTMTFFRSITAGTSPTSSTRAEEGMGQRGNATMLERAIGDATARRVKSCGILAARGRRNGALRANSDHSPTAW